MFLTELDSVPDGVVCLNENFTRFRLKKMLKTTLFLSPVFILFTLLGCRSNQSDTKILASVGSVKLTNAQLELSIPRNLSEIDSISFAQAYIENWVKEQLFLEKAKENIDPETEATIELMLNNYQTSLFIYKYQQLLIQQKLDTVVTEGQIEDYYKKHAGNFKLDSNVVRAIFVQIPKSAYDAQNVKSLMRSHSENDLISLEDYCYQNARNFNMGENWTYLNRILRLVPGTIPNHENFLRHGGFYETQDSLHKYFIQVIDYRLVNDTAPMVFVQQNIKDILLNHRKTDFINTMKNNLYRDAVSQKRFNIYAN